MSFEVSTQVSLFLFVGFVYFQKAGNIGTIKITQPATIGDRFDKKQSIIKIDCLRKISNFFLMLNLGYITTLEKPSQQLRYVMYVMN